jgi:hypothetical protein
MLAVLVLTACLAGGAGPCREVAAAGPAMGRHECRFAGPERARLMELRRPGLRVRWACRPAMRG